jgi:hypothetical protein
MTRAALRVAEQRQHLVADDPDDLLRRCQTLENVLVDRAIAHAVDERLHDLDVDVRFEQRHPDFPEGHLHGLRRQPRLPADRPEYVLETLAE